MVVIIMNGWTFDVTPTDIMCHNAPRSDSVSLVMKAVNTIVTAG
jgi:hypothetical protein